MSRGAGDTLPARYRNLARLVAQARQRCDNIRLWGAAAHRPVARAQVDLIAVINRSSIQAATAAEAKLHQWPFPSFALRGKVLQDRYAGRYEMTTIFQSPAAANSISEGHFHYRLKLEQAVRRIAR